MTTSSRIPVPLPIAGAARRAGPDELARALQAARKDTLAAFDAVRRARPDLRVPYDACLNPPLWELGHVGWFQEWWIARNPQRGAGRRADPEVARHPGMRAGADALYDSGRVPHATRWSLPLPDATATREDLARQLDATLELLARSDDGDPSLYFFRLALFHEDMHHEAGLYMAQSLGIPIDDARWQPRPMESRRPAVRVAPGARRIGGADSGFAFDNELPPHVVEVDGFEIDACVVSWAEYLPFVQDGGYRERALWSEDGWRWASGRPPRPRYLAPDGAGHWQVERFGTTRPLDPRLPACHLSRHEAEAWCRWAGRRLPTEGEWETAARECTEAFAFGAVWEWTSSPFAPYPGFEAHPYRDYSAPWFDGRPVLRGASFGTQPRLRDVAYRNFFVAERNDIFAGFRSCAS